MNDPLERKSSILIVDDVQLNVELLRTYLQAVGYHIIEAYNGEEALKKVSEQEPDLVLLDIMMPKIDGFEVCHILKSDPKTQFIPIIMLTALQSVEDKVRGIEAGADDFISKPFNKMELMARVKSLLRIKFLQDELMDKVTELDQARERLQQLAVTDGLTGLNNYRFFKDQLSHEVSRASRHGLSLSLMMMDIDYFKFYNDTHGHPAGDEVLRQIADVIKTNLRKVDIASRYGGEEFAIILPQTNHDAVVFVAEKLRRLIEEVHIDFEEKQPNNKLTISIGVATYPKDADNEDQLIGTADKRLYKAKRQGRNLVVYE